MIHAKTRRRAQSRDLQALEHLDPYVGTSDVTAMIGGRNGGCAHPNTVSAMVADGHLPPPDFGGNGRGPRKWRLSKIKKALRKLERRLL